MCNLWPFKKKLINEVIDEINYQCDNTFGKEINQNLNSLEQKNTFDNIKNSDENLQIEKKETTENISTRRINLQNLSAHSLWGSFIGLLRRENLMTLHTACGEIRDVELNDFVLKVKVYDEYLHKILTKEQNLEKIVFYLRQIDDRINVQFNLVKKGADYSLENLKKLRGFFGSELDEI